MSTSHLYVNELIVSYRFISPLFHYIAKSVCSSLTWPDYTHPTGSTKVVWLHETMSGMPWQPVNLPSSNQTALHRGTSFGGDHQTVTRKGRGGILNSEKYPTAAAILMVKGSENVISIAEPLSATPNVEPLLAAHVVRDGCQVYGFHQDHLSND